MAQPRSRLLDILQGAAPSGAGEVAGLGAPVGTDSIPTGDLEASAAPPPGAVEPGSAEALTAAPDMTPDEEAQLQAELALAARQRLMGMI